MDEGRQENQRGELYRPQTSGTLQTFLNTSGLSEDLPITAEFAQAQPQWRSRSMGERDPSSEAPVFRNSLLQFPVLCAHTEQTIPQSAARWSGSCPSLVLWTPAPQRPEVSGLVTSLLSSGGRVDAQCYFSKWHFCALFGCYVNNVEENGSQYVHGKTSLTWKTSASISQPPLAVSDQRSF